MVLREELLKYNELAFSYPADPPYEINSLLEQLRAKGYTPRLEQFVATAGHVAYCGIWVKQTAPIADPEVKNTQPGIELSEWAKNVRAKVAGNVMPQMSDMALAELFADEYGQPVEGSNGMYYMTPEGFAQLQADMKSPSWGERLIRKLAVRDSWDQARLKKVWDKDRFPEPGSTFDRDERLLRDDPDAFHAKFDAQEDGE